MRQRTVGFEHDAQHYIEFRVDGDAGWRTPALDEARAQCIKLALRQLCRVTVGRAQRDGAVESFGGGEAALRIALVE